MRWSLWVAGCSTSGTHERDLVPPGNAPPTESGGGTVGLVRWERNWERTLLAAARRARLCSLLDSDLGGWDKRQAGGVVVAILTSEGSLVRTQLRPPGLQIAGGGGGCGTRAARAWLSDSQRPWPPGMSVNSLRQTAAASTLTSHNCEALLRSLARGQRLAGEPGTALRAAAHRVAGCRQRPRCGRQSGRWHSFSWAARWGSGECLLERNFPALCSCLRPERKLQRQVHGRFLPGGGRAATCCTGG